MARQTGRPRGKKTRFQVLFLREDVDLSVTVRESETLDFGDIRKHLNRGDSVFITSDPKTRAELSPVGDGNREFALGTAREETIPLAEKTYSRSKLYYISDD